MSLPFTKLSIIIPFLNYDNIDKTVYELIKVFTKFNKEFKIIIVDDGSSIESKRKLTQIKNNGYIYILSHKHNLGKGAAIKTGISNSNSDIIIFTDCDLAYPAKEIKRLFDIFTENKYDVLCADRRSTYSKAVISPTHIKYIYSRERAGRIFNLILRTLRLTDLRDTQAGLKIIDIKAYMDLPIIKSNDFLFDVELLYLAKLKNKKIVTVPVEYIYHDENSSLSIYSSGFRMLLKAVYLYFSMKKLKS